jgi:hypothetical protein
VGSDQWPPRCHKEFLSGVNRSELARPLGHTVVGPLEAGAISHIVITVFSREYGPIAPPISLKSLGHELDMSDGCFSWCVSSDDLLHDPAALQERLDVDGYLYLPGYLDCELVAESRELLLNQLDGLGLVDRANPVSAGVATQPWKGQSCHHLALENAPLLTLLYSGRMIDLYRRLFNGSVRHFDFTWMRVMGPGHGTAPHCDSVYMGRGTQQLFTSWTPLMDITPDIGGLTIMPGSHRIHSLDRYRAGDVDTVCTNKPAREARDVHGWVGPVGDGKLTENPAQLQASLGLPWVTAEHYRPGDVVVFSIATIHGSLDNHSDRIRLSTDTRYQRADQPADERWIGENPTGHGAEARRDVIC